MNIEKERKKKEKVRLILMGFWMSGNDKFGRTRFFTWWCFKEVKIYSFQESSVQSPEYNI